MTTEQRIINWTTSTLQSTPCLYRKRTIWDRVHLWTRARSRLVAGVTGLALVMVAGSVVQSLGWWA